MSFLRSKPIKYSLITLAVLALMMGLLVGAFQVAVSRAPGYRLQLQDWLSEKTKLAIEFKDISARLRLYGPELVFDDAVVRTPDRTRVLATARRGSVAFDLWASITTLRLTAGRFTLRSPEIGLVRTREGRIQLVGQSELPEQEMKPISVDSLPIGTFHVRDAVVSFRDEITGRGPWSLSGISFRLERRPDLLQLEGEASLPHSLGQSLQFSGRVAGPLNDVNQLFSTLKVEGHELDLAGWADVLPNQWLAPETGHGSVNIVSTFLGVQPVSVTARVDLRNVSAASPAWAIELPKAAPLVPKQDEGVSAERSEQTAVDVAAQPTEMFDASQPSFKPIDDSELASVPASHPTDLVAFDRFAFELKAKRQDDTWSASVTDLDLSRKSSPWRARKLDVKWSRSEEQGLTLEAVADRIVLQNLWPVLAYLPESEGAARLRALNAHGAIENLELTFARAPAQAPRYSIKADLTEVGFDPVLNAPGLSGLSAHVDGKDEGGIARLTSTHLSFELPRMFRFPLETYSVDGVLAWERSARALRISSDAVNVASDDGNAHVRIALTLPADDSSPTLELTGTADDLNVAATSKYLPANKLTPKSLAWLDAAFVSGRVKHADVTLRGPLRSFPFRKREGEFLIRAQVEDTTFLYQDGWAPAEDLDATAEFHNEGMRVLNSTAIVGGLNVVQASGEFPDFHVGNMSIKARVRGDLHNALDVLQNSPLSSALGDLFQTLSGEGSTEADLTLRLPLKHMADRHILVNTRLSNATLRSSKVSAPMTHLTGQLTVRESLPESARFEGVWLGGPVDIAVDPVAGEVPASTLTANGRASAEELTPVLHLPASVKISGATNWDFTMPIESSRADSNTERQPRKLIVESDLQGLALALPYPLGKTDIERKALRVDLDYDGNSTILTRASLGDVRTLIRLRSDEQGWSLDRGGVRPDGVAAALPPHPGFAIDGAIDRLNLDDWFALKGSGAASSGAPLSDFLKTANLRVGVLSIFGYEFPDVRGVLRTSSGTWHVDVAGPSVEGSLSIPGNFSGPQPLTANLERLVIQPREKEQQKGDGADDADPRSWPNLQAQVREFHYADHVFGTVSLQATRVPLGVRIDSLTAIQEAARGEAHGEWLVTPDGQRSRMNLLITSTDVAATLKALNYTQFIDAKRGEITADLSWDGGFSSELLTRATGKVTVAAENGQLLNVQPGAGRVLGLFSVAALPRRLALDFSDLTDKGLSFDSIHGDFELRDGNAFTNNLLLRGPAAEIGIAGRTGIGARDYDQTAVVTGNLGASLPVAGALAGGPAVGAALLLFSQVFKEPLKGITRGYYRITGPWDNPVVERIDAAQMKEAAASTQDGA
jgi:uncharacterized protein (TIGR02099 family)